MSAVSTVLRARSVEWRSAFRRWRGGRPFWAGLLTLLAGLPIAYFPYANLTLGQLTVRMATTAGSGSLIIGVLLFVLGLTMWFQSAVRVFAGVASIMLALVSLVVSNIGGFLMGFLLALVGGALAVAWAPGAQAATEPGPVAHLPGGRPHGGPDGDPHAPPRPEPVPAGAAADHAADAADADGEATDENGRDRAE